MTLKKYLNIGLIGTIILAILLVVFSIIFVKNNIDMRNTLLNETDIEVLENSLKSENEYLSSQIRLYVETGNPQFNEKYEQALEANLFSKVEAKLSDLAVPKSITSQLTVIQEKSNTLAAIEIQASDFYTKGDTKEASKLLFSNEYEASFLEIEALFKKFEKELDVFIQEKSSKAEKTAFTSLMIIGVLLIIYITFILGTFIMLRNKMTPLFKMTRQAQKVAEGDLAVEDLLINNKANDEITLLAKAFNLMTQSLRNVLTTVSKTSNEVAAASEELLANAEQTNHASEKVALSIEQISQQSMMQQSNIQQSGSSLSNVTASIQQVAAAAENVSTISTDAHKQAESGQKDVQNTVLYMQEIETAVDDMLTSIKSLSEHSTNIETFVSAITEISDQTNLLALNAAIEAARAGEAGKGFAVVADEVRQLAEQSNDSANKITSIIGALQKEMRETAAQMEKVTVQVKNGVQTVNLTGKTFNDIQQATSIVAEQIKSVASITNQMTSSATKINATSEQLEITAGESATQAQSSVALVEEQYASMEEITAAANMLTQLASNLNDEISRFNV